MKVLKLRIEKSDVSITVQQCESNLGTKFDKYHHVSIYKDRELVFNNKLYNSLYGDDPVFVAGIAVRYKMYDIEEANRKYLINKYKKSGIHITKRQLEEESFRLAKEEKIFQIMDQAEDKIAIKAFEEINVEI